MAGTTTGRPWPGDLKGSSTYDLDVLVRADEVIGVARVQTRGVSMGGGRNEQARPGPYWNQTRAGTPGHGDLDLFPGFDPAGPLTRLTVSHASTRDAMRLGYRTGYRPAGHRDRVPSCICCLADGQCGRRSPVMRSSTSRRAS